MSVPLFSSGCLSRADSAKHLSISIRLLDSLASAGQIPRIKIGEKTTFRVVDLDNFVASKIQRIEVGK